MTIQSVAVLGAGVMGVGIAAQIANAGVPVLLLDIVPDGVSSRNQVAERGLSNALGAKPAPFMHKRHAKLIRCGNIEDDLEAAGACDWIIEAVVERLDVKQGLYARLEPLLGADTIISSNTSTIPLAHLVAGRSDAFARRFLITHFFNPPRYMRLLELVTTPATDAPMAARVHSFIDERLGKGVVECNDTPGFIANRIGTYWIQSAMRNALELDVSVHDTDAVLSGPFGIPKTGVFALVDLIGLDLMPHIMGSMRALLPADDMMLTGREAEADLPEMIQQMIADGSTGRKGKGGFYRLRRDGQTRVKEAIDLGTGEYRSVSRSSLAALDAARAGGVRALLEHPSAAGQLAWRVMSGTILYAATLMPEISSRPGAIDAAMALGYSWKQGPFALLDEIGSDWFVERVRAQGQPVPPYLQALGADEVFTTSAGSLHERRADGSTAVLQRPTPVARLGDFKQAHRVVARNASATLWNIDDGVACLEFHSKMNAIDPNIMAMLQTALKVVPDEFAGLVIHNEADNFSVGANVGLLLFAANMAAWSQIDATVAAGQQTYKALKYAPFPVVGAPTGMALGGGCEVLLHCSAVQAHAETYMGLVEVGVGLVPGWGGCKELLLRWLGNTQAPRGPMPAISKAFELISTAQVSTSAHEARDTLLLRDHDRITMNKDRLMADAKNYVLELAADYQPPAPPQEVSLPGATARVALAMAVDSFHKIGKATDHDCVVAAELAMVLSGGNTDIVDGIGEQDLYDLERQAVLRLAHHDGTLARLEHMLETGKPLRN